MHPFLSTRAAQRRRAEYHPLPTPSDCVVLRLTIDADAVTLLRQLVMQVCCGAMEYMRIGGCAQRGRMRACLCVSRSAVDAVAAAVARNLPSAELESIDDSDHPSGAAA